MNKEKIKTHEKKIIKIGIILTIFLSSNRQIFGEGVKLKECCQIAKSNHLPLKIAEENIELAKLKLKEARRNLLPSLSGKWEETEGKADRESAIPDFRERIYGIELAQSIYQGKKLSSLFRQAKINLAIAQKNYIKCEQDLIYEVNKSYVNAVKAQLNSIDEEKLLNIAKQLLNMVEKQYRAGLVTKLELLNLQSQYNQVYYQMVSIQKDASLALLELRQLMNLKSSLPLEIDLSLEFKELEISLDKCLAWAFENRLEIFTSKFTLEYAKYEKEIAKSGNRFRLDLTGFYGKSGSVYEDEEFKQREDWSLGIKLTKPLGSNTISSSYNEGKTSPKLGQTTRTISKTGLVSLSLLDNYTLKSTEKQASLSFLEALNELEEIKKSVSFEVRKSYFNYQKALLQVKSALKEIKFRKEEVKILKGKKKLNLVQASEVMDGHIKLTEAKISYNDALSFYHIALADLNKSIGIEKF